MAATNPTAPASWADILQSEYIDPLVGDYFLAAEVMTPQARLIDLRGKRTLIGTTNVWESDFGDVAAVGDSADNTASVMQPIADVNITAAKVGIARTPSVELFAVAGEMEVRDQLARDAGRLLAQKVEDDLIGKFTNSTGSVSHTGADMTVAHFLEAIAVLRAFNAPGPYSCVLDDQQAYDLQVSAAASTGAILGSDSLGASSIFSNTGTNGLLGNLFGVNIYTSTLCDASGETDKIGSMHVDARVDPSAAPYGLALAWEPTSISANNALNGTVSILFHLGYGVGILRADASCKIITDL